jgi:hypothetical protein
VFEFLPDAGLRSLEVAARYAAGRASSDDLFETAEAARQVAFLAEFYAGGAADALDSTCWPLPHDWELRATGEVAAAVWYACELLVDSTGTNSGGTGCRSAERPSPRRRAFRVKRRWGTPG